jgi:PiT family inorganic phosphate transporter
MSLLTWMAGMLLAYANGANDNFKGVATLFGSGTTSYRGALLWATLSTAMGSLLALYLASELLSAFTGRGLVPDEVASSPMFAMAVAFAAGSTVLAATRFGLPISTTHALIGALIGTGIARSPAGIDPSGLSSGFIIPLLTSPFIAIALALLLYPVVRQLRRLFGISRQTCVCVGKEVIARLPGHVALAEALAAVAPTISVADTAVCRVRYQGQMIGVSASTLADATHYLSAGAVSFARGVNDTPKIAALLLAGGYFSPTLAITLVAVAIAVGGLLSARRVAETMSNRITELTPGQGLTANLITASLVIGASHLGLPVSTTHVSCGSLFGIGATTGQARWKTIAQIAAAWLITLPLAAALGVLFSFALP